MKRERSTTNLASLGDLVRKRRKELGLTQQEVGRRVGWGQERISLLETGKYGLPSLPFLGSLADALQIDRTRVLVTMGFLDPPAPDEGLPPVIVERVVRHLNVNGAARDGGVSGLVPDLADQIAALVSDIHLLEEQLESINLSQRQIRENLERLQEMIESTVPTPPDTN